MAGRIGSGTNRNDSSSRNSGDNYTHDDSSRTAANLYPNLAIARPPSAHGPLTTPNPSASSHQDNIIEKPSRDQPTLDLVNKFKEKIQEKIDLGQFTNKEELIELEVSNIRRTQNPQLTREVWKNNLPSDIYDCRDAILYVSMAYGDDPREVSAVIRAKIEKFNSNENEDPATTSLDDIIDPLKKLRDDLDRQSSYNLFRAVLAINDNEIDRADRMFYSEACRLIGTSKDYTFDIAHDQVQAIRLMHYESDDKDNLLHFINNCTTFDAAYSYLQRLARKRLAESEPNATKPKNNSYNKSVITSAPDNPNDDATNGSNRLTNSARLNNNSSQQQTSPGRTSFQPENSQSERPDNKNNYHQKPKK